MVNHSVQPTGDLSARLIRGARPAPLSWRLRNALRPSFIKGWIAFHLIAPFANWWGVMTAMATLEIVKIDGATGLISGATVLPPETTR